MDRKKNMVGEVRGGRFELTKNARFEIDDSVPEPKRELEELGFVLYSMGRMYVLIFLKIIQ